MPPDISSDLRYALLFTYAYIFGLELVSPHSRRYFVVLVITLEYYCVVELNVMDTLARLFYTRPDLDKVAARTRSTTIDLSWQLRAMMNQEINVKMDLDGVELSVIAMDARRTLRNHRLCLYRIY